MGAMFEGVGLRYQLYINHTQPYTEKKEREKDLSSVHRDSHEPWWKISVVYVRCGCVA